MESRQLKEVLEKRNDLRKFLFIRGFLITDSPDVNAGEFPFYGQWKHKECEGMHFYANRDTGMYVQNMVGGGIIWLFGHAYNPFTMEYQEDAILQKIASHFGMEDFYDCVNELTGVFLMGYVKDKVVETLVDPSGMQSACMGVVENYLYVSSHPQLIADICGLGMDDFVKRLISYKWYPRVMGPYLPADLTPFCELKRIVPDIEYMYKDGGITHKRFYPLVDVGECKTEQEYQDTITQAADILRNNMELISRKWKNPWISLTGGIDSNTTFAAANGIYGRFHAFSYLSAEKETIDCEAAERIAARFDVPYELYRIPEDESELKDYEIKKEIIKHNNGYIALEKDNELRKRVYLQEHLPADVEVKSWVSETIRAYWYKHYGRKKMPKLSAKLFRNLYKIFITDRKLAHEIDGLFETYIEDFEYRKIPAQYPPADMHYNEVTWGSWGGLNISEMKFYTDITFAYNNRKFLDLMFKVPLNDRISDKHHLDMKKYLNRDLYDMNIRVVNMKETKFRAFCLNVIFAINSALPF